MSKISRRHVLLGGGVLLTGGLVGGGAAAGWFSTTPNKAAGATGGGGAKESPMLASRVASGDLPPLEQRLPNKPMVVTPLDGPGTYGGTLRRAQVSATTDGIEWLSPPSLVQWSRSDKPSPIPALAESWEVQNGGRVYVFKLRQGIKWSDGAPFTTDDLMFAYENVFLNEALNGPFPAWWATNGTPGKFVKVDESTIRFEFADPHGLLLKYLSFSNISRHLWHPKHYLSQFHEAFADKTALAKLMADNDVKTWVDLYWLKNDRWNNPEMPVLDPWMVTKPVGSGNTVTAERNPYYWKVDSDGRQLPYIDRVTWSIVSSDALGLRAANGDVDLVGQNLDFRNVPLLAGNETAKHYRLLRWTPEGLFSTVSLNQSHPDPVLRALFQNIDFRAGLSHAINRQEINDALLSGTGRIQQPVGQPEDPYFVEGTGKRFIEYDVNAANTALDSAGLTKRGSDGFRLRPDGKPLLLVATTQALPVGVSSVDMLEFVKRYWAAVGINVTIKTISADLYAQDVPQGKYDLLGGNASGYFWDINSETYVPTSGWTPWAPQYGNWYFDRSSGPEPTGDIRQVQSLYDQVKAEADDNARLELGREILKLHDKNVWMIGTVAPPVAPIVVNEDLGNVRAKGVWSYATNYDSNLDPPQIYFKHPEQHA